jgi:hypothetical protein
MTLGNVRANNVPSLSVTCWLCHHRAVPSILDPIMSMCRGIVSADARPNW